MLCVAERAEVGGRELTGESAVTALLLIVEEPQIFVICIEEFC